MQNLKSFNICLHLHIFCLGPSLFPISITTLMFSKFYFGIIAKYVILSNTYWHYITNILITNMVVHKLQPVQV